MKIREIKKNELSKIFPLAKEFIEDYRKITKPKKCVTIETALKNKKRIFTNDLKKGTGNIIVAEKDEEFIGYIFVLSFIPGIQKSDNRQGYISDLYIQKEFRKKKIAQKLSKEAEKWLKKKKINEIILDVNIVNINAKKLYLKLNYKEESIRMSKKLK